MTTLYQINDALDADNLNTSVSHKQSTSVSNMQNSSASNKQNSSVTGEPNTTVSKKQNTSVSNKQSTSVSNKQNTSASNKQNSSVTGEPNASVLNKQNTSVSNKQNTSVSNKQSTSVSNKQSTSVSNKQNSSVTGEPNTSVSYIRLKGYDAVYHSYIDFPITRKDNNKKTEFFIYALSNVEKNETFVHIVRFLHFINNLSIEDIDIFLSLFDFSNIINQTCETKIINCQSHLIAIVLALSKKKEEPELNQDMICFLDKVSDDLLNNMFIGKCEEKVILVYQNVDLFFCLFLFKVFCSFPAKYNFTYYRILNSIFGSHIYSDFFPEISVKSENDCLDNKNFSSEDFKILYQKMTFPLFQKIEPALYYYYNCYDPENHLCTYFRFNYYPRSNLQKIYQRCKPNSLPKLVYNALQEKFLICPIPLKEQVHNGGTDGTLKSNKKIKRSDSEKKVIKKFNEYQINQRKNKPRNNVNKEFETFEFWMKKPEKTFVITQANPVLFYGAVCKLVSHTNVEVDIIFNLRSLPTPKELDNDLIDLIYVASICLTKRSVLDLFTKTKEQKIFLVLAVYLTYDQSDLYELKTLLPADVFIALIYLVCCISKKGSTKGIFAKFQPCLFDIFQQLQNNQWTVFIQICYIKLSTSNFVPLLESKMELLYLITEKLHHYPFFLNMNSPIEYINSKYLLMSLNPKNIQKSIYSIKHTYYEIDRKEFMDNLMLSAPLLYRCYIWKYFHKFYKLLINDETLMFIKILCMKYFDSNLVKSYLIKYVIDPFHNSIEKDNAMIIFKKYKLASLQFIKENPEYNFFKSSIVKEVKPFHHRINSILRSLKDPINKKETLKTMKIRSQTSSSYKYVLNDEQLLNCPVINVDKNNLLESSIEQIEKCGMNKRIIIRDLYGLTYETREWFKDIWQILKDLVFKGVPHKNHLLMFNEDFKDYRVVKFCGEFFGGIILRKYKINNVSFTISTLKEMLFMKPSLYDLKEINEEMFQSLKKLTEFIEDDNLQKKDQIEQMIFNICNSFFNMDQSSIDQSTSLYMAEEEEEDDDDKEYNNAKGDCEEEEKNENFSQGGIETSDGLNKSNISEEFRDEEEEEFNECKENKNINNISNQIDRAVQVLLFENLKEQVEAFMRGFTTTIPKEKLRLTPSELSRILFGPEKINVEDWKNHTIQRKVEHKEQFDMFFDCLKMWNQKKLKKFFKMVTGRTNIPKGGFKMLTENGKSFIIKWSEEIEKSPRTSRKKNKIYLPLYQTREKMEEGLLFLFKYYKYGKEFVKEKLLE